MKLFTKVLITLLVNLAFTALSQRGVGLNETKIIGQPAIGEPPVDTQLNNQVIGIVNTVENSGNYINLGNLSPDSNIALPAGIIKDIGAVRYLIAIDSLKFKKTGAYFSAFAAIEFPGTTQKLAFRASNIKFNPAGVVGGSQSKLYLASTHVIQINPNLKLRLKGNGENWIEWDCNGFKAINLVGNFEFAKNKIIPDSSQTTDTVVTAKFQIYTQDIHNFITSVSISPFKIKNLNGWSFKVNNAVVDMSELANAPAFTFPPDYPLENLASPQAWTGFALQSLSIKLPPELSKTGKRTEITAGNMMIDRMGVSGIFQVSPLFNSNEGSMSGWNFSIDELSVGFVTNKVNSGHIKGVVNIPIVDSTQSLQYAANIHHNYQTNQTDYNFLITPVSNVNFKVFNASVNLNNNSSISVFVSNGNFKPSANLSGSISFSSSKFNSNGGQIQFQNLIIVSDAPYITNGVFALTGNSGGQPKLNNFPLTLNGVTLGINQGAPILSFSVSVNLSEQNGGSISVGTIINLKGKTETTQQTFGGEYPVTFTRPKFSFDQISVGAVSVNYQTGPFQLTGIIVFKDNDPIYGNGFFGNIEMKIPSISPTPMAVSTCFGNTGSFKYFYVDAKINTHISLGQVPIVITRLIGGLYYHMTPNKTTQEDFISLNNNFSGITGNALTYVPSSSVSVGLKAGASYECTPNQTPYNGDIMLEINFTSSGGLGTVGLGGDIYSMTSASNRANAPVKGKVQMVFDAPNKTFDASALVIINSYGTVTGSGYLKLHIDPETWYACIGRPSAPCNINFLSLANVPFYCMVGNTLDAPAPPPSEITALGNINSFYGNRNVSQLQNGGGFCAGGKIAASISRGFDLGIFSVNGSFSFDLGFDMMMANYGPNAHCSGTSDKAGVSGWMTEGSMYLSMKGAVNVSGHCKFPGDCPKEIETHLLCIWKHCCCLSATIPCLVNESFSKDIFTTDVNSVIVAKGPKPIYFAGVLNCHYKIFDVLQGDFDYDFSYGNNCAVVN